MVSKCRNFKKPHALTAFLLALFLAIPAYANIYPPKPAAHFYGDANGDTGVTGADIVQHQNFILSKPYTYDTLQPNNSAQSWNTCDMDSNRGCTGADNVILNSYLLSNGVSIGARPWELANLNLPLTDNPAATWIPFNIDLHSTHATLGLSGRPGVSVVVEIDPILSTISGQLSGRECNPVAGSRDQLAASNAQCALAVTQTNWPVSAGTGPTESGTYGLQVTSDGVGDLNLKVYTVAIPGLDIPTTSTRLTVSFLPVPDSVSLTCPSSVDEDATSSCTITAAGGSACAIGAATTCTGVTITDCTQLDIAAQGETAGPGSCSVEVTKGTASDSKTITISEVNLPPYFITSLTLIGTYDTPGDARGVYVSGNYAYVAVGYSGLLVIDIADPTVPALIGTYDTAGYVRSVSVSGNYAYLADYYLGLLIIDITNPAEPILTGTYDAPTYAREVHVNGNYAYLTYGDTGFQIINVSNPAEPMLAGSYYSDYANDIYVSGNYAYVAGNPSLQIIDVSNPALPTLIGTENSSNGVYGVFVNGNYAYLADWNDGLQIIDISNPAAPIQIGTYYTGFANDVYVSWDYAYVANSDSGLQVMDTSNPALPTPIGTYSTPGNALGVFVSGNYAYVADSSSGLQIISWSPQTTTATEYMLFDYVAQVADGDVPQQTLTCSKSPSDTCGGNMVGCSYSFTPNGSQGGTSCVTGLRVTDNGIPAMYSDMDVTVSILDSNYLPIVSIDCPESVDKDIETACLLSVSDADIPAQSLTCSIDPSSTCTGLTISECAIVTVPAQGEGVLSCTVVVAVQDDNNPIGTGSGSDMMYITVNLQPTIMLTCPVSVMEPDSINCTIDVADSDFPEDTLTCSLGASDTCGGTLSDCTNYDLASSAGKIPSCEVDVVVDDNTGQPNSTAEDSKTVFVGPESVALTCPSSVNEDATSSCTISASGPSFCAIGAATTCTGVTITDCTQVDIAAQGETAGPGSCIVEITKGTANDSKIITIDEVNQPPSINLALIPTLVGTYNTTGDAHGVYVNGDYAYVAGYSYGLQLISVSNPALPILVGTYDTVGDAIGVYVSGNYAYVADGSWGLRIINVTNPTSPTSVGTYRTTGDAHGVYVNGDYAYVADYDSGLQIIDITNPTAPTLTGTYNTPGNATSVYVSGIFAYVADYASGLHIIDVSNPATPTLIGTYNTPGTAYGVHVSGNYAYVADDTYGLQIIDVSNPTAPTLTGTYDTPGLAFGVYVSGNYAYVADFSDGLYLISVSNPAAPTLVGTYNTPGNAYGVYVRGNYAYVADGTFGLQIINLLPGTATEYITSNYAAQVADPDIPPQTLICSKSPSDTCGGDIIGCDYSFTPGGGEAGTSCVMGFRVTDNGSPAMYADMNITIPILDNNYPPTVSVDCPVSVDKDTETFCVLSASDEDIPAQSLTCSINPFSTCTGLTTNGCDTVTVPAQGAGAPLNCTVVVTVQDNNVPVGTSSGLDTISITGGQHPPGFITSPTLVGTYDSPGYGQAVYVSGNYAYVADVVYGLRIIDITNPLLPVQTGIWAMNNAIDVYLSGNYAYVANGPYGLQIIDVTNPYSPIPEGAYDTPGTALGVYVCGNYAYVADGYSGLQVIDITNPDVPHLVGSYDTLDYARGVYVRNNYAYVADGLSGLLIIDVSNPALPGLMGTYNTSGEAFGVHVSGNYAYVADGLPGLRIINVTNPAAPSLTSTYNTPDFAYDVYLNGGYAYVADEDSGLHIINVKNPAAPTLVGTYDTAGIARGVHVTGGNIYIADDIYDLQIIGWNPNAITAPKGVLMTYSAAVTDPDFPPQTLACSLNPNDTCGGVMVGCEYSFTPTVGQVGTSCVMGLRVTDDGIPPMYGDMDITVSIVDNNFAPTVFVNCPYSVDRNVETSCLLSASDEDLPAQSLTCSIDPSSTCNGLTTSGCATVTVPAQGEGAPISCMVAVTVRDSYTPIAKGFDSDMIYLTGANRSPSFITSPTLIGNYNTTNYAYDVYLGGNYAYVADYNSGLQIIDLSNPAWPTLVGAYDTSGSARGVYVSGNYAYVADSAYGLQIIDITNPAVPALTGTYNTPGTAYGVYWDGNHAYMADGAYGLQVIDVTNPTIPAFTGTYNTPGNADGIHVRGNYAYVADVGYGLQIINIVNPAAPIFTGIYNLMGNAYDVHVSGDCAYVADGTYGLQIINIINPASPTLAGAYNTPGDSYGVHVSGNYAYVADYSSGLQIIDITNPAAPTLATTYDTPGNALKAYVSGGYVYIADDSYGLQIIGWNPPAITAENSVSMTYKAPAADPETPSWNLTCSINPNDTCGGSMVDCEYSFTPGAGQIGTSCIMGLRVTDDGIPPMYGDIDIIVNIY